MELDEFKNMFEKNIGQSPSTKNNIKAMIYNDAIGPLTLYEKNLKFTLFIFPFVAILFGGVFISKAGASHSPTRWVLFAIFFIEFLVSFFNYGIVKSIRKYEGNIKENIINKISMILNNSRWYLALHELLYLSLAVALETSMHDHLDNNFNAWSKVNILVRLTVYAVFIIAQYFIKRASQRRYYDQHLERLLQLAEEME